MLLLADHFLEKFSREHGKSIKRISTPAIDMLTELSLAGQRARAREHARARGAACDGEVIHGHHLPPTLQTAEASGTANARLAQRRRRRLREGS